MIIPADIATFLHQYFDKILVLSVPRFTDRHEQIKKRLAGLPFDFFWGADKLQMDYEDLKNAGTYNEQTTKHLSRNNKAMNIGEVVCSLSHRNLYAAIVENGWRRVLIFEDDVLPVYDTLSLLPEAINQLPAEWELVYLGYLKHENITVALKIKQVFYKLISRMGLMKWNYAMIKNWLPRNYSKYVTKAGFHDCAHAYAITLSAAKKLVQAQTPIVYRADNLLSMLVLKNELNAFVTEPKFFDQEWFHNPYAISVKTV